MSSHKIDYVVSFKIYDTLKWLGLIGCPLLAIVLKGITPLFNLAAPVDHSMLVVNIIGLSIGVILAFAETTAIQDVEQMADIQKQLLEEKEQLEQENEELVQENEQLEQENEQLLQENEQLKEE